jgi:hypothetical protein
MSIHSVDDFEPTSSTPVFGSAVSQTKIQQQQQPINDLGGAEKLVTPPQPVSNGQDNITSTKTSENIGNGTTESVNGNTNAGDTTDVHVNGQNKHTDVDTYSSINTTTTEKVNSAEESVATSAVSKSLEKSSQNDPLTASSNEPADSVTSTVSPPTNASALKESEPALSVSADVAKEDSLSAPAANVANAGPPPPGSPVETTTTASNDDVPVSATAPEATVLAESSTPERKSKVRNHSFCSSLYFNFYTK